MTARPALAPRDPARVRVGLIDTGVNPWHSHVGGRVSGWRLFVDRDGSIREDEDFRDPVGHGTAVAGIIREGLPAAEIVAIRVFEGGAPTFPSLVARAILRAAGAGCAVVNLSLSVDPGPGGEVVARACEAALEAGCLLVASARVASPHGLPASLPGVVSAVVDDGLELGEVRRLGPWRFAGPGRPRDLRGLPREANLWGPSFACAHVAVHLARAARGPGSGGPAPRLRGRRARARSSARAGGT